MKKFLSNKRLFATLILSLIMIISFSFAFNLSKTEQQVFAYSIDVEEACTENVDNLRYGYNVTGGNALYDDGLMISHPILKPMSEGLYKYVSRSDATKTEASNYITTSAVEIAKQSSKLTTGGIEANAGVVNMNIDTNFDKMSSTTDVYEERYDVYYQMIRRLSYVIQGNVDLRDYLTEDFKTDMYAIKDEQDAIKMLQKYGTHLFTGLQYGGLMQVTNYIKSTSSLVDVMDAQSLSSKMQAAYAGYGGGTNFSFSEQYGSSEQKKYGTSNYKVAIYGGQSVTAITIDQLFTFVPSGLGGTGYYVYDRWVQSINDAQQLVLVGTPASARNVPLWDLLPSEEKYLSTKAYLINAYKTLCGDKYSEYLEKYPTASRTIGDESNLPYAEVLGYSITNSKGYTTYIEDSDEAANYKVYPGATVSFNYFDTIKAGHKKWQVTKGAEYVEEGFNEKSGTFTVKSDAITNQENEIVLSIYSDDNLVYTTKKFIIQAEKYSGGQGTEEDPYLLSKKEDFMDMLFSTPTDWDKHFMLVNDIDFATKDESGQIIKDEVKGLGRDKTSFSGTFDGNYHTLKNFKLITPSGDNGEIYMGLFHSNAGTIKNLYLDSVDVGKGETDKKTKIKYAGALVGYNIGTISNCKVSNLNMYIRYEGKDSLTMGLGAIAGCSTASGVKSTIENCSVEDVSRITAYVGQSGNTENAYAYVGCLVGHVGGATIRNCYVNRAGIGAASGDYKVQALAYGKSVANAYAGGAIGVANEKATIECIVVGDLQNFEANGKKDGSDLGSDAKNVGSLIGKRSSSTIINDCYVKQIGSHGAGADGNNCTILTNVTLAQAQSLSREVWYAGESNFPMLISQQGLNDESIIINTEHAKTSFYYGEEFSIAGVTVEGKYVSSNQTFEISVFTYDKDEYNAKERRKYWIKINALGKEASYEVEVREIEVVGLNIVAKEGVKFYAGEKITKNDFIVEYILENGDRVAPENLLDGAEHLYDKKEHVKLSANEIVLVAEDYVLGQNIVTAEYGDVKGTCIVNAEEKSVIKLEAKGPNKVTYFAGESVNAKFIDKNGIVVTATYSDGSTKVVDSADLEIIGDKIIPGENKVILSYGAYITCEIDVYGDEKETENYTVKFLNEDGSVISETVYAKGAVVVVPKAPTKAQDNTYTYEFAGWDKVVSTTCLGDETYTAVFKETYIDYTVKFLDYDGTELSSAIYHYGDTVEIPENPSRESDKTYNYTFNGWGKSVTECKGNTTYKAVYSKEYIEYTIKFINYDGSELSNVIYHYGDLVSIPTVPARASDKTYKYTFIGWDKSVSATCVANAEYKALFNSTYIEYTVKFVNWDNSEISSNVYYYDAVIEVPSNPERASDGRYEYTFVGWDKVVPETCQGNITIKATYSVKDLGGSDGSTESDVYTVKFLDWDNSVISSSMYTKGQMIEIPETPTRARDNVYSYTFKGWDKQVSETCQGHALYVAQYKEQYINYFVKFLNYDGSLISEKVYYYGEIIEEPTATRESDNAYRYTFSGWNKVVSNTCVGNATYTAQFVKEEIEYVVIFKNSNGDIISRLTYHYGETIIVPTVNKQSTKVFTYTFLGWDKEVSGACVGNATYTALFNESYIDYTVKFLNYDGSEISKTTYHYGDVVEVPETPTRDKDKIYSYTFSGWDKDVTECMGNATYKATYTKEYVYYTVKFLNDDGGIISEKEYHYGQNIDEPTATKKSDIAYKYTFSGWNKTVSNICDGNATYTAQYAKEQIEYVVTFRTDNGETISKLTYHYGDAIIIPNVKKQSTNEYSYTFSGWDKEVSNTCEGSATYTAQFDETLIEYTVKFLDYDGREILSETYHYGEAIELPATPTREADGTYTYTFERWNGFTATCVGNAQYVAVYTIQNLTHTVYFIRDDGVIISSYSYKHGEKIEVPSTPAKESDKAYTYTFSGWDKEISTTCNGNAVYTAKFDKVLIDYTVKFLNDDGSVILTRIYHYGDTVTAPEENFKSTKGNNLKFTSWDKEITNCMGNTTYTAQYEAQTPSNGGNTQEDGGCGSNFGATSYALFGLVFVVASGIIAVKKIKEKKGKN